MDAQLSNSIMTKSNGSIWKCTFGRILKSKIFAHIFDLISACEDQIFI